MATITQLSSGKWQCKIRLKGYEPTSKTFQTKTDAERWGKITESEMIRGAYVRRTEGEKTTFKEVIERYMIEVTPSKKGRKREVYLLKRLLAYPITKKSLATLTSGDLAKWRDYRLKEVKHGTVARELGTMSAVLSRCVREWGLISVNPVSNVSMPKYNSERQRRLSKDEEAYLMDAFYRRTNYMKQLIGLALETAMRQGELLGLTWKNVRKDSVFLPDTKNGTPREVPLSNEAKKILASMPMNISGKVFKVGATTVQTNLSRAIKRSQKQYKLDCEAKNIEPNEDFLEDLHFHDLRHEATSRLAGVLAMHELMKVTGHKTASMLARYYHPTPESLAEKMNKLRASA